MNSLLSITMDDMIQLSYLIAAIAFMLGIKYLSSPATARKGNLFASIGMLLAVTTTLFNENIITYELIITGLILGSLIGVVLAKKVQMTAMPQMVAVFNGFGGAASALIASAEFVNINENSDKFPILMISLSVLIGFVTFSGSIIAFFKLQELISGRAIVYPFQKTITAICFISIIVLSSYLIFSTTSAFVFIIIISLCLLLGILLVIPIGGADMPVVVSLLNSYSGLAAAVTGFLLNNLLLVISGSLVGAAGLILTTIMTKAMNRSLVNVIFGNFGATDSSSLGNDNTDKMDSFLETHEKFMKETHHIDGDVEPIVLCYAVFKSPELNNPFDPESGQTGNILYGLTEIYNGPEGVQAHMELGQSRAEMFSELVSLTNEYSVCAILGAPVIRSM